MNLHLNEPETHFHSPWVFRLEQTFNPKLMSDKDILTQVIYQTISKRLSKQLFEVETLLRDSLQGGLSLRWCEVRLEHFDLEGRFDRAVCTLHLVSRGPSRFWLETQFLRDTSLVTLLKQEGILYFEELGL